jgi:ornithine cyclodeaminase/alanine dehydrogenase
MTQPLYLSPATLEDSDLSLPAVADAIAQSLRALAAGRAWSTPKSSITPAPGRLFMSMLAASESPPCAIVKAVGLDAGNAARGLPHIGSTLTLLDGRSGLPLAIMDGAWVTGVRTAAMSALCARHLAPREVRCLAFVGCGEQARRHLAAFAAEHPLRTVHAVSRTQAGARAFARHAQQRFGIDAHAHADARGCLGEADVIVTTVPAADGLEPFLDPDRVRPGAFVAACDVGRCWRPGLAGFDIVAIDDRAQEASLSQPMLAPECVDTDLGALVTGAHAGRTDARQRTAFVFRGMAIADLATAWLALRHAVDAGHGERLAR